MNNLLLTYGYHVDKPWIDLQAVNTVNNPSFSEQTIHSLLILKIYT